MLGLATHEPNFTIIREEFKPNQPKPCDLCGQIGWFLDLDLILVSFMYFYNYRSRIKRLCRHGKEC